VESYHTVRICWKALGYLEILKCHLWVINMQDISVVALCQMTVLHLILV